MLKAQTIVLLSNISGVTTMLDLSSLKAHNRMIYQLSPKNADEGGLMGKNEGLSNCGYLSFIY